MRKFIAFAFGRHCHDLHGADYEVCDDWICRLAWWIERRLPEDYLL